MSQTQSPTRVISDQVRAFLEEPRFAVMATINRSGTPQLTVMWYALHPTEDVVVLNATRGLLKERNLRRDARMSLCVEDGMRYVSLQGRAELDRRPRPAGARGQRLIAPRYIGQRLGTLRWEVIKNSDRVGIWMHVTHVRALRV